MTAAVFFDFNGVLVDDEELHRAGFNAVLAEHGLTMTPEVYAERYLGFDDRGAFTAVFRDHGRVLDEPTLSSLVARKAEVYAARAPTELRFFDGAAAWIERAAAMGPVAIVSGALRAEIELALGLLGVRAKVGTVVAAEDVTACKPHPEGYLRARHWLRDTLHVPAPASDLVAIEDSLAGIESARAAGLAVAAVAHSYPEARLRDAGAHVVRPTLAALQPSDLDAAVASARVGR